MQPTFLIVNLETGIVTSTDDEDLADSFTESEDHAVIDLKNYDSPAYFNQDIQDFALVQSADEQEEEPLTDTPEEPQSEG